MYTLRHQRRLFNTGLVAERHRWNGRSTADPWGRGPPGRRIWPRYYDGTEPYGNPGDLMLAQVEDANSNVIDTSYYRYYTPADAGTHRLHPGLAVLL